MKKKIHIIYKYPKYKTPLLHRLFGVGSDTRIYDWPSPLFAPFSIAYNLSEILGEKYDVQEYDLMSNEICDIIDMENEIVIGHPWAIIDDHPNLLPDENSIFLKTLLNKSTDGKNFYMLIPYEGDPGVSGWYKEYFIKYPKMKFIAFGGDYWVNYRWDKSPMNGIIDPNTILTVNNSIDPNIYKKVKHEFSIKGQRKFLYIGRTNYPKNIKQLELIAKHYPNFQGGYIGNDPIEGWTKISKSRSLKPSFMKKVAKEYDFFISPSAADAQVTTVMENICWGFGLAATRESGYNYDSIINIDPNDLEYNLKQIAFIQQMEEEEIKKLVEQNQKHLRENHSWELFGNRILNFLDKDQK